MGNCDYCHKDIYLPHKCKFCKEFHCSEHLLPENHECKELNEYYKPGGYFKKLKNSKKKYKQYQDSYEDNFIDYGYDYTSKRKNYFKIKKSTIKGFFIFSIIFVLIILGFYYYSPIEYYITNFEKPFKNNLVDYITNFEKPFKNNLVDNRLSIYSSELHWGKIPIKYGYDNIDNCYPIRVNLSQMALSELTKLTNNVIKFERDDDNPEILFKCDKYSKYDRNEGLETEGEAEYYIQGNEIVSATIYLYGGVEKGCESYPSTELHELLHAFGVEHNNRAGSIMIPVSVNCLKSTKLSVDKEIYDKLIGIYS